MTLTNHFITGVAIAVVVKNPYVAFPIAVASHYILDSLPHYGFREWEKRNLKIFYSMIVIDIIIFTLLLRYFYVQGVPGWYYLAGFFGYLPDIAWIYRWLFHEKFGSKRGLKMNTLNTFHSEIQKFERLWGIIPEIFYGLFVFIFIRGSLI